MDLGWVCGGAKRKRLILTTGPVEVVRIFYVLATILLDLTTLSCESV